MEIKQAAMAGTLESCDCQVRVEPADTGIELELKSDVIRQYGKQIRAVIQDTLSRLQVENARVTVVDKGALDCTIRARVECALFRSAGQTENIPWGGSVR